MTTGSPTEEGGLFLCARCGHRAEAHVDTSAEVFVDEESRQSPRAALGLVRCPSCGRRDVLAVAGAALVPALIGLAIAAVLAFAFVFAGMLAIAGPDVAQNDARFPYLLGLSILAGFLGGGGFVAWKLRAALHRAAQNVTFGRAGRAETGDGFSPSMAAPGRSEPLVSAERRHNIALQMVTISAVLIGLLGHGSSLPGMLALGCAAAVVAGAVRGDTAMERGVFSLAAAVTEVGILLATRLYTEDRSEVWNFELLLPLVLGGLPGGLVYLVAVRLLRRREG